MAHPFHQSGGGRAVRGCTDRGWAGACHRASQRTAAWLLRRLRMIPRRRLRQHSPITIDRALTDPHLLGAALGDVTPWQSWLTVLRSAFGLVLTEDQLATFHAVAGERGPP